MAGYIFSLNNIGALKYSIEHGIYSTILKIPKNQYWQVNHEGTFGDYITMKEGDNVYFFHDRKIYGIGRMININGDCKFLNFPNADLPQQFIFSSIKNSMILNSRDNINNRMLCIFTGNPYFFKNGVDMDEVLTSNPSKFKMLRAFWKLSFIKIDDEENKALMDVILKSNEKYLTTREQIYITKNTVHKRITKITNEQYKVNADNIIKIASNTDGSIKHEMALEVGILDYIANKKGNEFGHWDYLSHQVIASPFKPIDYMDKMDIFGYRYISGYSTISKFLVIEIKKETASIADISQLMKYVDWVNQEYCYGNYEMIEAFLVANKIPEEVRKQKENIARRNYTKSRRPPISKQWYNLRMVEYQYCPGNNKLKFREVE